MKNQIATPKNTSTLNINAEDIPPVLNVRKLDVNDWEDISNLVAETGGVLTGPFQVGKPHKAT